jgi:hypothetical protein
MYFDVVLIAATAPVGIGDQEEIDLIITRFECISLNFLCHPVQSFEPANACT